VLAQRSVIWERWISRAESTRDIPCIRGSLFASAHFAGLAAHERPRFAWLQNGVRDCRKVCSREQVVKTQVTQRRPQVTVGVCSDSPITPDPRCSPVGEDQAVADHISRLGRVRIDDELHVEQQIDELHSHRVCITDRRRAAEAAGGHRDFRGQARVVRRARLWQRVLATDRHGAAGPYRGRLGHWI